MIDKFIKFKPTKEFFDLIESRPTAFCLFTLIVARARRTPNKINGLDSGEAYIGDHKKYGVSRQVYRSDLNCLKSTNWITFRSTTKGTIAKVVNTDIFDLNISEDNQQNSHQSNQQPTIKQPLTKNVKNVKITQSVKANTSSKEKTVSSYKSVAMFLTRLQIYNLAWELKVPVAKVISKYHEVLNPENREKYDIRNTQLTLRKWLERSISKNEIAVLTEFEHIEMLKHERPDKKDERIVVK